MLCNMLKHMRLYKIMALVFTFLFVVPIITHYFLLNVESNGLEKPVHHSRTQLDSYEDFSTLRASDLRLRIDEMLHIKNTVSVELRDLEARRQRIQSDISVYNQKIDELKQDMARQQAELDRLKISVEQAKVAQREAIQRNTPELALPRPLQPVGLPPNNVPASATTRAHCTMATCFDHSRCSLSGGFPVYLYDPDVHSVVRDTFDIDGFLKTTIKQTLGYNAHLTHNAREACIFVVLVGEALYEATAAASAVHIGNTQRSLTKPANLASGSPLNVTSLRRLLYWGGDGRNHVLINLSRRDLSAGAGNAFAGQDTGRAILVQSAYAQRQFRVDFDLVVPPVLGPPGGDVWQECAAQVPARRRYLLSFQGDRPPPAAIKSGGIGTHDETAATQLDDFIVEHLRDITTKGHTQDLFLLQFQCVPATEHKTTAGTGNGSGDNGGSDGADATRDWSLCGTDSSRKAVLRESTFVLLLAPDDRQASSTLLQARLYEALRSGAIPVLLGGDQLLLPYTETIEWSRAVLRLPKGRCTELHFLLRSVPDADLLVMRRQARLIWEHYLSSVQATVDTIVASLRDRIGIPPRAVRDIRAQSVFNGTFQPLRSDVPAIVDAAEAEESLGPMEPPSASAAYRRNYTGLRLQQREIWNEWFDPFRLYPQLPFDPVLPSDSKFLGSGMGFRPIGKGAGGAGKEFGESLGGNNPREQFTIVMLTYEREQVLMDSLGRLFGLPYLHKVVVVWNSPKAPLEDLRWPEIGVNVTVVRAQRNSLNNRFMPFDVIETEAILSVDDDAHLRHDEILFGFRVWREHRDRVVGFPGRYHAWDMNGAQAWNYNSNYSCELSMVLTGAAFFHRHYTYLYTYTLPQAIRDKVDEYMNCEDIAMNFLVSHVTRKPPVKVTSRWTFRCPGCPVSLSEDDTHFQERHKCINFFAKVFGYMPLLNTQYRADSILFKTRIPHDKQKCFKYI